MRSFVMFSRQIWKICHDFRILWKKSRCGRFCQFTAFWYSGTQGIFFWTRISFVLHVTFLWRLQLPHFLFYRKEKRANLLLHAYSMHFWCTESFLERFEVEKSVSEPDLTLTFRCGKTLKNSVLKLIFSTSSLFES